MSEEFRDGPPPQRPRREFQNSRIPSICEDVVTVSEKIFFPVEKYPRFNFVGRLLGPKGSTLKELVHSTKTKISILGKGSSKDKAKEEELSKSDDPEHAHYKEALHVLIQAKAPKIVAHRRMSFALKELNHFMVPRDDRVLEPLEERPPFIDERDERRPPAGRDRGPPAPIIRIGVPPPSSLILNEEPIRGEGRRGGREPPPARDAYPPEDNYYEGRRGGDRYSEPRDSQRYDYPDDRGRGRSGPSNGYSPKRYKEDPYHDPYAR